MLAPVAREPLLELASVVADELFALKFALPAPLDGCE